MIALEKINSESIPIIIDLANTIWWQHYPEIIGELQVEFMLATMYTEAALRLQMERKGHAFFLIKTKGKAVGFISIAETNAHELFINKFYILQTEQGKNHGALSYEKILNLFPSKTEVRLTVHRQNYKSINFYFKMGFKIEKVIDLDLDKGFQMNDFVMVHKRA
jgi:diamine N-acetyltransferase